MRTQRPEFVSQEVLDDAADTFIKAIGHGNADFLSANLRNVLPNSDAMRALNRALVANFNIVRQEQIRQANEARRGN